MSRVPTVLETPRLRLRPLTDGDDNALLGVMGDPEVMAYWDSREIRTRAAMAKVLADQLTEIGQGVAFYFAVEHAATGEFLGCVDLSQVDRRHHRAEVGFIMARASWGEGYALEAMQSLVTHAAQQLRLHRLSARTHAGNLRSIRLLERLGFKQEGLLKGYVARDGVRRDCPIYGLLL